MEAIMTNKEIIDAAFAYVYPSAEELIKVAAKEHAIANMGQELADAFSGYGRGLFESKPQELVPLRFSQLVGDCESDEMADGVDAEYREWLKTARKDVGRVQKAGLPLTLANVRDAFENKGVFAKKSKKK
jgi:hypothetical protein